MSDSHPAAAERVTIIGDGQMGLVLANILAGQQPVEHVRIWGPFRDEIEALGSTKQREDRLPGFELDNRVETQADEHHALEGATIIINAIPTQYIRPVWKRLAPHAPRDAPIVCVSKGIENETLLRPLEIIEDVLGEPAPPMVCLSGPTIARELEAGQPATMAAASETLQAAERVQRLLTTSRLRIYTNDDVIGVEIAGAAKNVIALAAGMIDGLGLGYNAKSALLARGLAEIVRLGMALGARQETFFGVAGVGDLATTCFCPAGRNRTCGERLARGETLEEIEASSASVFEGVATARSIATLADREGIDLPITTVVYRILFEGLDPFDAIDQLMAREPKAEEVG